LEVNSPSPLTAPASGKASWLDLLIAAAVMVFPLLYLCSLIAFAVCFDVHEHLFIIAALPAVILTLAFVYCYRRSPAFGKASDAVFEFLGFLRFVAQFLRTVLDILRAFAH
jgi:hypothetical protein